MSKTMNWRIAFIEACACHDTERRTVTECYSVDMPALSSIAPLQPRCPICKTPHTFRGIDQGPFMQVFDAYEDTRC